MLIVTLRPEAIEKFCEEKTYNKYISMYPAFFTAWCHFLWRNKYKVIKFYNTNKGYPRANEKTIQKQKYLDNMMFTMNNFVIRQNRIPQDISKSLAKEILYITYQVKKDQPLNKNRMQSIG